MAYHTYYIYHFIVDKYLVSIYCSSISFVIYLILSRIMIINKELSKHISRGGFSEYSHGISAVSV